MVATIVVLLILLAVFVIAGESVVRIQSGEKQD